MSKRDILTVCELAAHLMVAGLPPGVTAPHHSAPRCAADAMALQRLGARCKRWAVNRHIRKQYWDGLEYRRIGAEAEKILRPYGLTAKPKSYPMNERPGCLMINGLPGNTGGDESGFGI